VTIQAQFLDQMWRTARETGSAVLLMTQDLGIIANYCDRVMVLEAGRLAVQEATPAFFAAPRDAYSRALLSVGPAVPAVNGAGPALLAVKGLSKAFTLRRSGKTLQAVNKVDLTLRRGETLGLVGESGSGKTTVGRCLLRLVEPDAGEVMFDGQDLLRLPQAALRRMRRRVQIVFQDPLDALDPRWRVRDILAEAMERRDPARLAELLEMVGLPPVTADQRPRDLSAGAQQRVGIARAVAAEPALIVLDEPTSALTPLARVGIVRLLRDLQARLGTTFLFISHDLNTVEQLSHRVAVMYLGQVVETGTRDQVFNSPRHPYSRALLAAHLVADPLRRRVDRPFAEPLRGEIPSPVDLPCGCFLASRCAEARPDCAGTRQDLVLLSDGRHLRCLPEAAKASARPVESSLA
jgi:oligopeptide/dipeptide ABC transporter ATP-binding protein